MILVLLGAALLACGSPGTSRAQETSAAKKPPAADNPNKPNTRVAGSYGNWTLVCGKEGDPKTAEERCSLVLPLIEKETQKLVFRVILVYGPKGDLVLRVDGPTGVALQRGVQIATDSGKVYGLPFQTCLPMGCKALNIVADEMQQDLKKSKNATIVVHALNGKQIQTVAQLKGLDLGLEALDKKRTALLKKK
jgi:invasion protein IalB